ncbi:MAG: sigma-70 family RNA polymerase sigma factor [Candidatus Moraniibacteriota bacterium]
MEKSDQQLIADFLAGDDESFEFLVYRYLKSVYNFIYRLTGDPVIIDDLTQETFIKAWKNIRRYDQSKNFKVWLFAIAKNTVYDFWKKKKTLPFALFEKEDGSNKLEDVAEDIILPDEILMRMETSGELDKKIKLLGRKYQLILTMHYKDDLSLREISEVLGLPYNTIKSQHKRALNELRNIFLHP